MSLSPIKRKFYQKNPVIWIEDRLGVPRETIQWSLADINKYHESGRLDEKGNIIIDGWDGTPDPFKKALDALATGWKRNIKGVAIESATGTGKTFICACAVLWFLDVYGYPNDSKESCKVATFAPKEDQLKDHMWTEINTLWPRFKKIHPQAELMKLEIRMGRDNWNAKGISVGTAADETSATKAQGHHAKHLLVILEETPGIHPAVLEAVDNTLTGEHNMFLAVGNPDSTFDPLHQLFERSNVESIRISAFDHPNVILSDSQFIPGATTRSHIDNMLVKYKEDTHPMFMSRVRGICPDTVATCLFRPNALRNSKKYLRDPIDVVSMDGQVTEGELRVYFEAHATHLNRYLVFADVAGDAGSAGTDFHAAIVMDRLKKRPAAVLSMKGPRSLFVTELLALCERYKVRWNRLSTPEKERYYYPLLNWERRGVGALVLDDRVLKYPAVYQSRNPEIPDANLRASMGWDTNAKTRKDMITELDEWGLTLFEQPTTVVDSGLHFEMSKFVWTPKGTQGNGRYEAAKGFHDDIVMAWAGCLMTDKLIGKVQEQTKETDKERTMQEAMALHRKNYGKRNSDRWKDDGKWQKTKIPRSF